MKFSYVSSPMLQLTGTTRTGDLNRDFAFYVKTESETKNGGIIRHSYKFEYKEAKNLAKLTNKDYINNRKFEKFLNHYILVKCSDEIAHTSTMKRKNIFRMIVDTIKGVLR